MTRSPLRSLILTASAAATILCVATPAFAQESPPPGAAASAVPPPMQAMAAPKGSEDMTGSLGFGVGVAAGAQTLITTQDTVALKYWLSDVLAVSPLFSFDVTKPAATGSTTLWHLQPGALILFVPFRSTSTRLLVGGGLTFRIGKDLLPNGTVNPNSSVSIAVPITAGVEHFFTRWFSMGIAAQSNLIEYQKDIHFESTIDTTQFVGSLFFYTD